MMLDGLSFSDAMDWYFNGCWNCRHFYSFNKLTSSSNHNWITVFLSDYSKHDEKEKDGRYDLVIDFYALFDYFRFLEFFDQLGQVDNRFGEENPHLSTCFFISGYKMDEKPRRGNYYLNLKVLAENWRRDEDYHDDIKQAYFISCFTENGDANNVEGSLLVPAENMAYPQEMFLDYIKKPSLPELSTSNFKLKVNNVEQGNWNEILADDVPYLIYDIGTNSFGKNVAQDIQNQLKSHPIQDDVNALFISHWHADHFNILTGMHDFELGHIKQFVCTTSIYSLTAFNIVRWFNLNPGTTLCMQTHPVGVKWQRIKLIDGKINLYVRRFARSNPNNSGLLLFFKGHENSVILTGDANYSTVQEISNDGIGECKSQGGYYMVVPHHGGAAGKYTCNITQVTKKEAIVSVGEDNPYDHPDKSVKSNLQNSFPILTFTCDKGYNDMRQL